MELLVVNSSYQLEINPLALGISFVSNIVNEDKSESKELAIKQLWYVSLMYTTDKDYYLNYSSEEDRSAALLRDGNITNKKSFITTNVRKALKWFKELEERNLSVALYNAAAKAAEVVKDQLSDPKVLLDKKKTNGDPVYKIKDILDTVNQVPTAMDNLAKARDKVILGRAQGKTQFGSKEKNLFEDGL
jgi:hypothetical protein